MWSLSLPRVGRLCIPLCVFFSSRRRHTRFDCDWSSDVCSSDLTSSGESPTGRPSAAVALMNPTCTRALCPKMPSCETRSEEHTSELQSQSNLVCRLLLEKKKRNDISKYRIAEAQSTRSNKSRTV